MNLSIDRTKTLFTSHSTTKRAKHDRVTSQNTQEDAEGREEGKDEEVTPYLSGALLLTDKDKWTRNLAGKFP